MLSNTIHAYWSSVMMGGKIVYIDELFTLVINARLDNSYRIMMVKMPNQHTLAVVSPEVAEKLDLLAIGEFSQAIFRQLVTESGLVSNSPVEVFYFSENEKTRLAKQTILGEIKRLTMDENTCVAKFEAKLSKDTLNVSGVRFDAEFVFGAFEKGELVCVASGSKWSTSPFTDVRVITLDTHQELGMATAVVRKLSQSILSEGGEPQFRCPIANEAALGLTDALELTVFGQLEIVAQ